MSAASFLGISALVYTSGYDGLICSLGFQVGWPMILFLIGERLRNLGRYTFSDVASYRLKQMPIRTLSASGALIGGTNMAAVHLANAVGGSTFLLCLCGRLRHHPSWREWRV